jgi:hypothetical protein
MKRTLLLSFLFILFQGVIYGQFEFEPNLENEHCLTQRQKAELDFEKNYAILKLKKKVPFSDTQKSIIEKDYGIKTMYPDIFIEDCYNHRLVELLSKKHKIDFLEHTLAVADSIDKQGNGNSNEKLIIKENTVQEYIQNKITKKERRFLRKKYGRENIYLTINIDENGKSWCYSLNRLEIDVSQSIYENANNAEKLKEPIIWRLINGKNLYQPRIRNGVPQKTAQMVMLNF